MLAVRPELVRCERFGQAGSATEWGTYVEGVLVGSEAADFTEQGNGGSPSLADADKVHSLRVAVVAQDSLRDFTSDLALELHALVDVHYTHLIL